MAALFLVCGLAAGLAAAARAGTPPETDSGTTSIVALAASDPAPAERGWAFVVRVAGANYRLAVAVDEQPDLMAGDTVRLAGTTRLRPSRLHRNQVAGWMAAREIIVLAPADGWMGAANAVRSRVFGLFPEVDPGAALMRGFLIGDTSAIPPLAIEEMKRAGLVHFVAVSGGNVALFLGAVWLALGVLRLGPRQRAALGLVAVVLFVLVTRWEPSVVRAGLMVGLVLGARLLAVPLAGWSALGLALTVALLVSPELLFDVGFQLSVLATAGLLLGSRLWDTRRPRPVWRALAATLSAQLAVSPLLIAAFGSVPSFAAVSNVLAAPVVTAATALGWAATFLNLPIVASGAGWLAGSVLELSRLATSLPQVGALGLLGVVAIALAIAQRPLVGMAAAVILLAAALVPGTPPPGPVIVFLDVGQGDAALLRSGSGSVVAVDTGPDPIVYAAALRRHGISHIDLLVLTHSDRDHVGGLGALPERVSVSRVWAPAFTDDRTWDSLLGGLDAPVDRVRAGAAAQLDELRVTVLAPGRRFAADNDGSVVLWIESAGVTALLGGDVEAVAQAELPPVRPDVLLVPHHGSRTTDLAWLERTVGQLAVLSYGRANPFGHPAAEIVDLLRVADVTVRETPRGDVVVPLHRTAQLVSSSAVAQRRPKLHCVSRFV